MQQQQTHSHGNDYDDDACARRWFFPFFYNTSSKESPVWSLERLYERESRLCICGESYAAGPSYHNSHDELLLLLRVIFSFFFLVVNEPCSTSARRTSFVLFLLPFDMFTKQTNSLKVTNSCQWVSLLQKEKKKVFVGRPPGCSTRVGSF